jgi:hypothetical protein
MTAVLLDNGSAQTEAEAHAFCFGGEKWLEQLLCNFRRNALPQVNDGKLNPTMRIA